MNEFYNKHYITVDGQNRVISGWSNGLYGDRKTDNAVCINERGGYQFRLFLNGEENPPLTTLDGIPLYKWDGKNVLSRTEEEITADRTAIPAPPPSEIERLRAELKQIQQTQLDIQLALCEAYELMSGGDGNG